MENAITLLELNNRVASLLNNEPRLRNVWIVAETSDVRISRGHCYMVLIDKDEKGNALAKASATIWSSTYRQIASKFESVTGSQFKSDIKVMLRCSVTYHPLYGLSLSVSEINPEYTLGDLLRRRAEMIAKLQAEGVLELNRKLPWALIPRRIAVVSAPTAAGYGDFINQLYTNRCRLRFFTDLFPATMQGTSAPQSIIAALAQIEAVKDKYDCVVLIRGGGATSDLAAFDDYSLARTIATFPLPVLIGIGHERDVTLLDYVANVRVKTPTAAAAFLINFGEKALENVYNKANEIYNAVTERLAFEHRRIDTLTAQLPLLINTILQRERQRIGDTANDTILTSVNHILTWQKGQLNAYKALLDTLSPEATLKRGFSITRLNGKAVTSAQALLKGDRITTTLLDGSINSQIL